MLKRLLYLYVITARLYYFQSSVNYSKKAIKNHHGEVTVVVHKKINTYNTNSKKKKKLNRILNQAPCICAWVLAPQ